LTLQLIQTINLKLQLQEIAIRRTAMNLLILGATGRTGQLVVDQALAAGHTVTALVRSPEKVAIRNSNLRVVAGRATDPEDVARALANADAVLSTLGGGGSVIADSTGAIVEAAHRTGVRRVVVLSSFFVDGNRLGAMPRLLTGVAMGSVIKDKSAGEQLLRQSDLDWTIIYASVLKDGPASGSVELRPEGAKRRLSDRISRADVAEWMVQAATSSDLSRRSVGITEGTRTKEHVAREAVEHD
jgi:uncharacterized protein YbjT (DUF2867 family)